MSLSAVLKYQSLALGSETESMRVVSHTQVAASHKVDIVGVVGIEITHHVGSLV